MNSFWVWFKQNGDKVLAFVTAVAALAETQHQTLHLSEVAVAWITFASGIGTLAHTIFFTNTPAPPAK